MAHTPLTYLFGFTALFMVFVIVASYAYAIATYTREDLEMKQYRLVAEDTAARIRGYATKALLENTSLRDELVFPCEAPNGQKYNIYIGYGAALPRPIRERENGAIDDNSIYVVVARPDNTLYAVLVLDDGQRISLRSPLYMFSSTAVVVAEYKASGGHVLVDLRITGVRSQ